MSFADCPVCGKETNIRLDVRNLSEELTCNVCGAALEMAHDYSGEHYDLSLWLQERGPEADAKRAESDRRAWERWKAEDKAKRGK